MPLKKWFTLDGTEKLLLRRFVKPSTTMRSVKKKSNELNSMQYDLYYFISKFKAIPDSEWITGEYGDAQGRRCALGHCKILGGYGGTPESKALGALAPNITQVNDGLSKRYLQKTPKARVLAYLSHVSQRETT